MNKLTIDKKANAVGMLWEGTRIRSVERITGIHRDTIMRLGVRMGEGCQCIMDEKMRNLTCRLLQVDEVWGYEYIEPMLDFPAPRCLHLL
jgi:hypothetical protein